MKNLSGYPYCEIQFTKDGDVFDETEVDQLRNLLKTGTITDLFVISHGWNNDMDEARDLYKRLVAAIAGEAGNSKRKFAVLGVLWPSKKFAEKDLIASGAASIEDAGSSDELSKIKEQLKNLEGFFDKKTADALLKKARKLLPSLEKDKDAQTDFVNHLNKILTGSIKKTKAKDQTEANAVLSTEKPTELLLSASDDWTGNESDGSDGGAASIGEEGSAAGIGDFFGNILSGARNLLNFVTFYQMKERAGKVGSNGLNKVLKDIRKNSPAVKLHLIGHSFGGRLVTAAVAGANDKDDLKVDTLTLLQAAFSHYGFADKYDGKNNGFFRRVIGNKKVMGPVLISHTHRDTAVGLAYAIASRLSGQEASALVGGANDLYGGMGGNGAQHTPEANNNFNLKVTDYDFKKGIVYNLNGDSCISGHSDICKKEVGKAVIASVESSNS